MLQFGRMLKFGFKCHIDLYSWLLMDSSRVSENMTNSEKQSCENNSNNRYECRQGTRSRGCSVQERKKRLTFIQSWDQNFYDILTDMINWNPTAFIDGCIDGFSRQIIWLKIAPSNKNPSAHLPLPAIIDGFSRHIIWLKIAPSN